MRKVTIFSTAILLATALSGIANAKSITNASRAVMKNNEVQKQSINHETEKNIGGTSGNLESEKMHHSNNQNFIGHENGAAGNKFSDGLENETNKNSADSGKSSGNNNSNGSESSKNDNIGNFGADNNQNNSNDSDHSNSNKEQDKNQKQDNQNNQNDTGDNKNNDDSTDDSNKQNPNDNNNSSTSPHPDGGGDNNGNEGNKHGNTKPDHVTKGQDANIISNKMGKGGIVTPDKGIKGNKTMFDHTVADDSGAIDPNQNSGKTKIGNIPKVGRINGNSFDNGKLKGKGLGNPTKQ
jgi:hypothetical protein